MYSAWTYTSVIAGDRDTSNLKRTMTKDSINRMSLRLGYQKDSAMAALSSRTSVKGLRSYLKPRQATQRVVAPPVTHESGP